MSKNILNQYQWSKVVSELENEIEKLNAYDHAILEKLGDVAEYHILDYGAGPGIIAAMLKGLGANIKVFDPCKEMREISAEKIGRNSVFDTRTSIPDKFFDVILCNLVLCIITEEDVVKELRTMTRKLHKNGKIFIGFCNPLIFEVKESKLDYRFPVGKSYNCVHDYNKIKKEGNYVVIEKHRPIEWYTARFTQADLKVVNAFFTPEYSLEGLKIQDFIIFELIRND